MEMTVGELMEILGQYDPKDKVRIGSQPSWPFEYEISGVTPYEECIYIMDGRQIGYFHEEAWDHAERMY